MFIRKIPKFVFLFFNILFLCFLGACTSSTTKNSNTTTTTIETTTSSERTVITDVNGPVDIDTIKVEKVIDDVDLDAKTIQQALETFQKYIEQVETYDEKNLGIEHRRDAILNLTSDPLRKDYLEGLEKRLQQGQPIFESQQKILYIDLIELSVNTEGEPSIGIYYCRRTVGFTYQDDAKTAGTEKAEYMLTAMDVDDLSKVHSHTNNINQDEKCLNQK